MALFLVPLNEEVGDSRQNGNPSADDNRLGGKVGDHVKGNQQGEDGNRVLARKLKAVGGKLIVVQELDISKDGRHVLDKRGENDARNQE